MSEPSTRRQRKSSSLPRLEHLFLDYDIDIIEVEPYLRALGFVTKSAWTVRRWFATDTDMLKFARRYGYILVCHDRHEPARKRGPKHYATSGKPTPASWFSELAHNGGRVIEIEGGQQQPALEAVGKLVKHRHEWLAFFAESHGAVLVHSGGMTPKGPERLLKELGKNLDLAQQFPEKPKVRPKLGPQPKRFAGKGLTPPLGLGGAA